MRSCLFSFSFFGHIWAQIKIWHNCVHVLNFLVTFLLLTTKTALTLDMALRNLMLWVWDSYPYAFCKGKKDMLFSLDLQSFFDHNLRIYGNYRSKINAHIYIASCLLRRVRKPKWEVGESAWIGKKSCEFNDPPGPM